jgi:hypothetical protein
MSVWGFTHCRCCGQGYLEGRLYIKLGQLDERLRQLLGPGQEVRILSGYRCPDHNAATPGSSKTSWHMRHVAADVVPLVAGMDAADVLAVALTAALDIGFRGVGYYPDRGFLHLDERDAPESRWVQFGAHPTGECLRWTTLKELEVLCGQRGIQVPRP